MGRSDPRTRSRKCGTALLVGVLAVALAGCRIPVIHEPPRPPEPPARFEPPPKPEPPKPTPLPGPVPPAADDLIRAGHSDGTAREIICFTYDNFYDPARGVSLPSEGQFANSVALQLAPQGSQLSFRLKAQELYGTFESLQQGDFVAVAADLGCL